MLQLKHTDIVNGRVIYQSGKTGKHFDIKLIEPAKVVLSNNPATTRFIFDYFKWKYEKSLSEAENELRRVKHLKDMTAHVNKNLKIIADKANLTKKVSTHIARHTSAKMAIDKIRYTNITKDLLGHSNMKVHELYVKSISQSDQLDQAADDIFG